MIKDIPLAYADTAQFMHEITPAQLEEISERMAVDKLNSIPESRRSYFYYKNAEDAKAAFKRTFSAFLADRYVITPTPTDNSAPSPT